MSNTNGTVRRLARVSPEQRAAVVSEAERLAGSQESAAAEQHERTEEALARAAAENGHRIVRGGSAGYREAMRRYPSGLAAAVQRGTGRVRR